MPLGLTPAHLILILVIALIVVGPGKLPDVGSALGKSIKEFRKAASDVQEATSLTGVVAPAPAPVPAAPVPVPAPAQAAPAPASIAAAVVVPAAEAVAPSLVTAPGAALPDEAAPAHAVAAQAPMSPEAGA